jgi:hypothetical protein
VRSAGFDAKGARAGLSQWAPVLLRALYERDVRRRYCPAALWLAPYRAMEAGPEAGKQNQLTGAAVMRGLLAFSGEEEEEGEESRCG